MIWLPILALALAAFSAAAIVLRLPRGVWTLFGAALLFGLAGYALQGSPGQPAAPRQAAADTRGGGAMLVEARRAFYGPTELPSRFVMTADGYTRQGEYASAAGFLRNAVIADPRDCEAWVALGNVLIEHAEGQVTPPALNAFARAAVANPRAAAAPFFHGFALLRGGDAEGARAMWREALARTPGDAPWRPALAERLARLDALIAGAPATSPAPR